MARYKPQEHNGLFAPEVRSDQLVPGIFACALNYLVDYDLDVSSLEARFDNDEMGAST